MVSRFLVPCAVVPRRVVFLALLALEAGTKEKLMTPRRLIRWRSFWLGILVLGFLGWAWRDSLSHTFGFQWKQLTVANNSGGGVLVLRKAGGKWRWRVERGGASRYPSHWDPPAFFVQPFLVGVSRSPNAEVSALTVTEELDRASNPKEWAQAVVNEFRSGSWALFAPYWLLILLFLVPWTAFLAWRWQRQCNLTKAHDAPPAH